jgi:type II secretory pathway component PulF
MNNYQYRVLQSDGAIAEGSIQAQNRQDAFSQLQKRGWSPVQITESKKVESESSAFDFNFLQSDKVSYRELENFTRMLSSLLAAGVPLSRALVILQRECTSPAAQKQWKALNDLVVDGVSLADAMGRFPQTFPKVYTAMVQAGETGGFLDIVLHQIAEFQNRDKDLRAKVVSAMIYPCVLLMLAVGVLIFLLAFFIPRFQTIFTGFGADLPLITQIIVGASDIVRNYGIFVAMFVFVGFYFIRQWVQSDQGKRKWENLILKAPVYGALIARFSMARFCRMLGTLLNAGVPLIHSLNVARKSINNQTLYDMVSESIEDVKKGERLAVSMSDCKILFSGSVLEMITVAEESGRLDQELIRLADVTEQDLDRQLKTAVALTEPLMLFLIAGLIGTIFIGMVIPIFSIQDYIK